MVGLMPCKFVTARGIRVWKTKAWRGSNRMMAIFFSDPMLVQTCLYNVSDRAVQKNKYGTCCTCACTTQPLVFAYAMIIR